MGGYIKCPPNELEKNMRKLIIEIKEPSRSIMYKGRKVRSPVKFEIFENELVLLEGQLRQMSIKDYSVTPFKETTEDESFKEIVFHTDDEVIIEDLCEEVEEPKSILDKLIKDNK